MYEIPIELSSLMNVSVMGLLLH